MRASPMWDPIHKLAPFVALQAKGLQTVISRVKLRMELLEKSSQHLLRSIVARLGFYKGMEKT